MNTVLETVLKSIALISAGTLLLRFFGRKSISQTTIGQTILMISIGTIITQPIITKSISNTLIAASSFVLFVISMEFLGLKFDFIETLLRGRALVVIQDGQPVVKNLKKLRLTVDRLETRLRQQGIESISYVKTATLEPNGQLGYELMRSAKPVTIGEMEKMLANLVVPQPQQQPQPPNIFDEVVNNEHRQPPPESLQ